MKLDGKRKLIVILSISGATLGIATAMVFAGVMPSLEWADLAKWVGTGGPLAFAIGNGLEHLGAAKKQ